MEIESSYNLQKKQEMKPEPGKWYYAKYGHNIVVGKCVCANETEAGLKFRWGSLWRSIYIVKIADIMGEAEPPSW